ncbi:MAG: hypothetical protein V4524_01495 [Patescibacteria group bacterium]
MRTYVFFLLMLAGCVALAYYQDKWLPQVIDFTFQKSTPTKNADDADRALYEKYKSFIYTEPYEECYVRCAQDGFEAFKFCAVSNKCASIK